MESSFCRARERTSRRLARLAHVITSMHSAAPQSVISSSRDCDDNSSRNETTLASTFSFSLGYCCRSRAAIRLIPYAPAPARHRA